MVQGTGAESGTVIATNAAAVSSGYVDWPAIFAGAVLAAAIAFILGTFGTALGLTLVSPFEGEGLGPTGMLVAVGLWSVWVTVSSFMAGGYVTGRLRQRIPGSTEHEVDIRDGTHGLIVWAVGVIVGVLLLASGTLPTAKIGAQAAGAAATATAAAADKDDASTYRYLSDLLLRTDGNPRENSGAVGEEIVRILQTAAGKSDISSEDRRYLAALVANGTGVSQQEATARVDQAVGRINALEEQAKQTADKARKFSIVAAFVLAASLLIAAAGAWWAAARGGQHRDEQTVFVRFGRSRF